MKRSTQIRATELKKGESGIDINVSLIILGVKLIVIL